MENPHFAKKYMTEKEREQMFKDYWERQAAGKINARPVIVPSPKPELPVPKSEQGFFAKWFLNIQNTLFWKSEQPAAPARNATREDMEAFRKARVGFLMVKEEWLSYEMDLLKIIDNPFLFNMREPDVREFNSQLSELEGIFKTSDGQLSQLRSPEEVVAKSHELSVHWHKLQENSKRFKDNSFEPQERSIIQRAKGMLNIALNSASSPSERQVAYKRALESLSRVISIPQKAKDEIEARMPLLALEAAPH